MEDSLVQLVLATPSVDPIILEKSNEIHKKWIYSLDPTITLSPTLPNNAVFTQLATNVVEQTTVLQQLNNLAEQRSKDNQKGIPSIHPSFKKMILVAFSEDGTDVPSKPVKLYSDFFSQKSAVHAQIHLLHTLQAEFKCAVTIMTPFATALYHGNFLWDRTNTPNNFCCLLLGKPSSLATSSTKEAMILDLKSSKGGGWSNKDL